jgi:septal ring factor EnvC (AmiA/AmiB activator)
MGFVRLPLLALLTASLLITAKSALPAPDATEKAQELKALRTRIQSLQDTLESDRKKKSRAEQDLHEVERHISAASRALRNIENDLKLNRRQLDELRDSKQQQASELKRQRDRLAAEVRAAYAMGRQQQVKLLLNQEQPSAISRMMVYFRYASRARNEQIDSYRRALSRLEEIEASIQQKSEHLTQLHKEQEKESKHLQEQKQARERLVIRLAKQLESRGDELKRLKADEQQLQELVYSLQELLADIPADTAGEHKPFKTQKGKLPWPARGRLAVRFGSPRGGTGLKWQGVMITAPEGGNVRAVLQGRVAFADWMRGFGLLLIIDHGEGYMSLYGHNQALYKEVGEWVDTGEVVATLGTSGGQMDSGLYFELRHNGRPINPSGWCAGKPAAVSG